MISVLKESNIFKNFNEQQLTALYKLGERKVIESNSFLFQKDEEGLGIYVVIKGTFTAVYENTTKIFKLGDCLSAISLIIPVKHKMTPKATQKSEVFFFSRENFEILCEKSPKFALTLQTEVFKQFVNVSQNITKIYMG